MTCSKAVLVQVLLFNQNPSYQREKTSRGHRGHIAGLPWNPAACQSLLHSKSFGLSERLDSQSFSLHRGFLGYLPSPRVPTESYRYLLQLLRSAILAAGRAVIVSLKWWDSSCRLQCCCSKSHLGISNVIWESCWLSVWWWPLIGFLLNFWDRHILQTCHILSYLYVADISLTILIKSASLLCVKHHASSWGASEKWETSGMVPSPKCWEGGILESLPYQENVMVKGSLGYEDFA